MYVEEMIGDEASAYDSNLGWGFHLPSFIPNPVHEIQRVAKIVQKRTPAPLRKFSPVSVVRKQLSDVRKVRAQHTALAKFAAAKSPLLRRSPTVQRWTGLTAQKQAAVVQAQADAKAQADAEAQYAKDRAAYEAAQAAADAKAQAEYDAAQAKAQADYDAQQAGQAQIDADHQVRQVFITEQARTDARYDASTPQAEWNPSQSELDPMSYQDVNAPQDASFPPEMLTPDTADTIDTTGDNTMQLSNIESSKQLFPGDLRRSGMGDIWGDLMTTATNLYGQKTAASIQQSQAAQADAQARIAAANAAALAAQKRPAIPMMLGIAGGLGVLLLIMRRKRGA